MQRVARGVSVDALWRLAIAALLAAGCSERSSPEGLDDAGAGSGCDPVRQEGCESGQACYFRPESEGGPLCEDEGNVPARELCDEHPDCEAGFGCAEFPLGRRQCSPYCTEGDSTCTGLEVCEELAGSTSVGVCTFAGCDPILQNCSPAESCYFADTLAATFCSSPGATPLSQTCTMPDDCQEGYHCGSCGGASRTCRPYCGVGAAACGNCVMFPNESFGVCCP